LEDKIYFIFLAELEVVSICRQSLEICPFDVRSDILRCRKETAGIETHEDDQINIPKLIFIYSATPSHTHPSSAILFESQSSIPSHVPLSLYSPRIMQWTP
jgi:hypothetical protein